MASKKTSTVTPGESASDEAINKYYPFIMEIRKRVFFVASVFLIGALIGFFSYERLINLVFRLLYIPGINIVVTSPFQFLNFAMSTAMMVGLVLAFPLIIYQVLSFLRPALTESEFKKFVFLIPFSLLLFIVGFVYGAIMMRYVIFLFFEKSVELELGNVLDITMLVTKIITTSVLMGLAFQFPIVLTLLMRLGILKYKVVVKQHALAWVVAVFFAAFLPPTDILSLLLLTLPLVLLFEFTLLLNKSILKSHLLPEKKGA